MNAAHAPLTNTAHAPLANAAHAWVPVRCRRAGAGERPVRVLLLHGLGGGPSTWHRFADLAAPHLELLEADLPWSATGTGEWSRQADATPWIRAAVAAAGDVELVVAHSFAANVLLEAAATGGPSIAAVLVSPFYRSAPAEFDWATIESYLDGFHGILDDGLRVSSGDRLAAGLRRDMALRLRERLGPYGWMRFFDSYLRSPLLDTAAVTAPCLVVSGTDDLAAPPRDGRTLAMALPRARFEALPAGHLPMIEQAHRFAELVGEFAATLPLEIT
ncbi:putative hydrolase [[Actinomadura] parvosata subsp. kistnae]|uniref:alpha/beta fold hydrolase n=1 Tax=[Actinomadura] parvosata TaxID=1955412 RepID=UPI0009AE10F9|nr:alpha/beta fold hydrolase [Nonomuraea sp. ATCC 55076]SPL93854.1 putative hydrolase [Actinomadura parvosata subsp. kistnae]